eukprot:CAMPEP_0172448578 /NCGR_PEP_ID=MMETSP1065-20121228/7572_1 /TAXON_ID=265537 /ORGANISM="Amphiprora paludosa, Strain CCMP125" /LENGTH=82 /DNA_ID=CAMNT_0013200125 /DNA_START=439 /DNA_END=687 /DNA_ORIENTATION=-
MPHDKKMLPRPLRQQPARLRADWQRRASNLPPEDVNVLLDGTLEDTASEMKHLAIAILFLLVCRETIRILTRGTYWQSSARG